MSLSASAIVGHHWLVVHTTLGTDDLAWSIQLGEQMDLLPVGRNQIYDL